MSKRPSAPDKAVCQYCGREFLLYNARCRYCCAVCRQRARWKRCYAKRRSSVREYKPTAATPPPKCRDTSAAGFLHAERRAAAEKRRAMMARLAERDRSFAEWAGQSGKPRQREFRPKDIQGIANEDLRRWY